MTKGASSHGLKGRGKNHITCRRCGKQTYHAAHKECSSCGFGKSPKLRRYSWQNLIRSTGKNRA